MEVISVPQPTTGPQPSSGPPPGPANTGSTETHAGRSPSGPHAPFYGLIPEGDKLLALGLMGEAIGCPPNQAQWFDHQAPEVIDLVSFWGTMVV